MITERVDIYGDYQDVMDYAALNIPEIWALTFMEGLIKLNKLFGTNYKGSDLIEDSLTHWQSLLPDDLSQPLVK